MSKEATREWTPEDGVVVKEKTDLQRSWKRGGSANSYDFTFTFEGATIYARYPKDLDAIQARQDSVIEMVTAFNEAEAALIEKQNANPKADIAAERKALIQQNLEIEKLSAQLSYDVAQECVVGWTGAPEPYSEQAKEELPFEITGFWFQPLLDKSRLSQVEANFLAKP